ncbi:unnamed protein product [Rotaria socialis]|uniref:Protein kinase domain-containing protein n=1 Tax=Rotaria socialis TaxID=392032 RepID=A0A818XUW9_9BILA|nr:unnamed protein product [Rotaria socialis]CAF4370900.1 unnamed protein product [Rotaria socialis]
MDKWLCTTQADRPRNLNKPQAQCFQDFIVCLGEFKTPSTSLDNEATIAQVCQYLANVLKVQNRRKIYGFVTNLTHMTFYCAEKKPYSTSYHYYKSQHLEMFNCLSKTSSSVGTKRKLNKEAWEIFTKFLTMNPDFYQYTTLNINPLDDLRGDRYSISRKLGTGVTSMAYSLVKKQDNYLIDDVENCVIKISKRTTCSESLINELKIIEQLKQSNNQNKFDLFFENVIDSSPAGNFLVFQNELLSIESLTLIQSKQLIDVIQYLYDCRIIHRDLCPPNLMLDKNSQHLKLIDFGYARTYEMNEITKEVPIEGTTIYAGEKFLLFYSRLSLNSLFDPYYAYERTFDLKCALNVIMVMSNCEIRVKMDSINALPEVKQKVLSSLELWKNLEVNNENYSKLLNSINNLTGTTDFDVIKDEVDKLFKH